MISSDSIACQFAGNRYVVSALIGRGGMAEIYLARDKTTGTSVAIKCLSSAYQDNAAYQTRLCREAEILACVRHPNVVRLLDADLMARPTPYLVLEVLAGESVHDYVERRGAMSIRQAMPLAMQLGGALGAVHLAGCIHGDVKPHNVFLCGALDAPSSVKLIDFGCALPIGSSRTDGDMVAGTPEYMAPEQILGDPVDQRTDIYAFGIVLFRWLTAELPFCAGSRLGVLKRQLLDRAPRPSCLINGFPRDLESVIQISLRKDPDNRYPTAGALLTDLTGALKSEGHLHIAPIVHGPDRYHPRTQQGRRALGLLSMASSSAL